jgi:hypothetical protein
MHKVLDLENTQYSFFSNMLSTGGEGLRRANFPLDERHITAQILQSFKHCHMMVRSHKYEYNLFVVYSSPSSVKVDKAWSYISTPIYVFIA